MYGVFFVFKQKTAYEMRISDWSSDVCSSDLVQPVRVDSKVLFLQRARRKIREFGFAFESNGYQAPDMTRLAEHVTRGGVVEMEIGRASCRERVCQYV